ncbi:hypothetical protein T484DRAFT_1756879, partial [Cryptophyta sp. CCMP2293]
MADMSELAANTLILVNLRALQGRFEDIDPKPADSAPLKDSAPPPTDSAPPPKDSAPLKDSAPKSADDKSQQMLPQVMGYELAPRDAKMDREIKDILKQVHSETDAAMAVDERARAVDSPIGSAALDRFDR